MFVFLHLWAFVPECFVSNYSKGSPKPVSFPDEAKEVWLKLSNFLKALASFSNSGEDPHLKHTAGWLQSTKATLGMMKVYSPCSPHHHRGRQQPARLSSGKWKDSLLRTQWLPQSRMDQIVTGLPPTPSLCKHCEWQEERTPPAIKSNLLVSQRKVIKANTALLFPHNLATTQRATPHPWVPVHKALLTKQKRILPQAVEMTHWLETLNCASLIIPVQP